MENTFDGVCVYLHYRQFPCYSIAPQKESTLDTSKQNHRHIGAEKNKQEKSVNQRRFDCICIKGEAFLLL
jgi:hypothetical protein